MRGERRMDGEQDEQGGEGDSEETDNEGEAESARESERDLIDLDDHPRAEAPLTGLNLAGPPVLQRRVSARLFHD